MAVTPTGVILGKDEYGNPIRLAVFDSGLVDAAGKTLFNLSSGFVEANSLSERVVARPTDVGALGSYGFSTISGNIAAGLAAASPVFGFRWAQTPQLCLIKRISASVTVLGTGFTAGLGELDLFVARTYTAPDTAGNAVNIAAGKQKFRASFGSSLIAASQIEIANTGALTAGTRTLDTLALAQTLFTIGTQTNTVLLPLTDLLKRDQGAADWPLVLAQNEGFVIQATVPATGIWQLQVAVEWLEVATF
jgi:hypothetical protein